MSALVMGLVWELQETPEFGRAEKFVLLAYADHADSNGKNIFPSITLVTKKTFYEERNVQKTTRSLETLGYLVPDGVGPHGTNRFAIPIELLPDGGAKITPITPAQDRGAENAPVQNRGAENAPEENAPEENAPEPSVVVKPEIRFAEISQKLSMLTGGGLNSNSADMISGWLEIHANKWILKAIDLALGKNARSEKYVDAILIGWESNGYPKTREERIKGAKNAHQSGSEKSSGKTIKQSVASDADRAAAERVLRRRAERLP